MAVEVNYQNKTVTAIDSVVNVRKIPAFSGELISGYKSGVVIGRSSGNTLMMVTDKWIQANLTTPVNGVAMGYVVETYKGRKNVRLNEAGASPVAEANAQPLLDAIVKNDKESYTNLLLAYNKLMFLKSKNVSVPTDIPDRLIATYLSLANRSRILRSNKDLICTTGKLKSEADLKSAKQLENLAAQKQQLFIEGLNPQNIGDFGLSALVIIIIIAIAAGTGAAIMYYSVKPDYEKSKIDLKISEELKKALGTLSPADQQKVIDDITKQINDANRKGHFDQSWKDFFKSIGGKIALGVTGFLVVTMLMRNNGRSKK